eukprot:TRINITY_DN64561_c0_g1_i1.p1 TRINITY_DN64561_c0_g1~~TRINITY_DN64561_c0_g1_i1.p1  ORF type:complete len:402 (+),score=75.99 TRINITY_DN64561_c0_g1_i1:115-1320(+)
MLRFKKIDSPFVGVYSSKKTDQFTEKLQTRLLQAACKLANVKNVKKAAKAGLTDEVPLLFHSMSKAPLPPEWKLSPGSVGSCKLFLNQETGEETEEPPLFSKFAHLASCAIASRLDHMTGDSAGRLGHHMVEQLLEVRDNSLLEAEQAFAGWQGPYKDEQGIDFYHCPATGACTWNIPGLALLYVAWVADELRNTDAFPKPLIGQDPETLQQATARVRSMVSRSPKGTAGGGLKDFMAPPPTPSLPAPPWQQKRADKLPLIVKRREGEVVPPPTQQQSPPDATSSSAVAKDTSEKGKVQPRRRAPPPPLGQSQSARSLPRLNNQGSTSMSRSQSVAALPKITEEQEASRAMTTAPTKADKFLPPPPAPYLPAPPIFSTSGTSRSLSSAAALRADGNRTLLR